MYISPQALEAGHILEDEMTMRSEIGCTNPSYRGIKSYEGKSKPNSSG